MRLARVVGNVESTMKHPDYRGQTLLLCKVEAFQGNAEQRPVIALDRVDAGVGDRVLILTEGTGVRQLMGGQPPVRSVIVAVVDRVDTVSESS
ncbi:MAG: EutN/CcmL family microcompartment protein [Bradymonadia bacterium]